MSAHRASGVLLQTREEPLVKMVRGDIHEWREQTAIKSRRGNTRRARAYTRFVENHDVLAVTLTGRFDLQC